MNTGNQIEQALRISNWVAFGGFIAITIAGIIDAQVRFKGTTAEDTPRYLPDELEDWVDDQLRAGAPFRWIW